MCGIYFCYGDHECTKHSCLKNRGPDRTKIIKDGKTLAAFYRLAIVGIADGMQPFSKNNVTILCNGEIYNHLWLEKCYNLPIQTRSDCECILHLYHQYGIEKTVELLEGEFALILYDANKE